MLSATELALHRKGTQHFIEADFTDLILTPRTEQIVDGTKKFTTGTPRIPQTFKIIWPEQDGIIRHVDPTGGVRRFDFILVGLFDAEVEIGDTWQFGHQVYIIEYRYPDNGYEVKVGGVTHGSEPLLLKFDSFLSDRSFNRFGNGTLSAAQYELYNKPVNLNGNGTLSATQYELYNKLVNLGGNGTLSATQYELYNKPVNLNGNGTLSATQYELYNKLVNLGGNGTLSASVSEVSVSLTPIGHFDFHEGSGSTASSIIAGVGPLTAVTPATAWSGTAAADEFGGYIGGTGAAATITEWTIALDLTVASLPASEKTFFDHNQGGGAYWNLLADGKLKWYPSTGGAAITSTGSMSAGSPQTLALVTTATGTRMFINGTLDGTNSAPVPFSASATSKVLNNISDLVGTVDDLRFWNVALSDLEVAALVQVVPVPLAFYDFHEGSGPTAVDIMGNKPSLLAVTPATAWSGQRAATQFNWDNSVPNTPLSGTGQWSMCFDIQIVFTVTSFTYFFIGNGDTNFFYLQNNNPSSRGKLAFWSSPTGDVVSATDNIFGGVAYRVVATSNASTLRLYVDGVQVASGSGNVPAPNTNSKIASAGDWPAGSVIDNVRLWDVALTPAEVAAL